MVLKSAPTSRSSLIVLSISLALVYLPSFIQDTTRKSSNNYVCAKIANATSSKTSVNYPGDFSGRYAADIEHWAKSSTNHAICSVRPGTPEDVATILQIVGSTRTPFAVKGGGHSTNANFSSTTGVHISMSQFDTVQYDAESQTATVGAGLVWDDVYAALIPYGVNVVGGRISGVGVAGFLLGGGYSWLTNQYGLGVDSIVAYELVKPTGQVITVTAESEPELFFGLKGGMNNFGIVTQFVLKTYPQTDVWGGVIHFTSRIPDVTAATVRFSSSVTDPKASIITTYNQIIGTLHLSIVLILFYDGPTPPPGIFDEFLAIPSFSESVYTRNFLSLVRASPSNSVRGQRITFNSIPVTQYTPNFLDAVINETLFWGKYLRFKGSLLVSYDVEPFLPTILTHTANSSSLDLSYTPTAYPPSRATGISPFIICYSWFFASMDDVFYSAIKESAATLERVALEEGQDIADQALYPNYAMPGTPLEKIYGANLPRLRQLRRAVDPENVMDLAGGFRI